MKKNLVAWLSVVFLSLHFTVAFYAQTDRKLKLTFKPTPSPRQCRQKSGTTVVKVTFDKSGEITETKIIKTSGCFSFDSNSVEAARGIKFEPEIRNGEAVTIIKPVEYIFRRP